MVLGYANSEMIRGTPTPFLIVYYEMETIWRGSDKMRLI